MPKMIEISAAEYERLNDCIREDGMRIAALIEENKTLQQDVRRLAAYGLYCQLCETLTGKPIAKMDELLTAAKKARREQVISDGAYKQCEAENTKLKEMAAEDILRAALSGYPCNSCVNNMLDVLCDCDCADCEHHCTCHECHDSENFVWRGGK